MTLIFPGDAHSAGLDRKHGYGAVGAGLAGCVLADRLSGPEPALDGRTLSLLRVGSAEAALLVATAENAAGPRAELADTGISAEWPVIQFHFQDRWIF